MNIIEHLCNVCLTSPVITVKLISAQCLFSNGCYVLPHPFVSGRRDYHFRIRRTKYGQIGTGFR